MPSIGEVLTLIACKVRKKRLHTEPDTKRFVTESVIQMSYLDLNKQF